MSIKLKLTLLHFLEFAVWGAWLITLGKYLEGELDMGEKIGSFYATMGIASLFMPAIIGIIADRWIPAQRLLGLCHLMAALMMIFAAQQTEYLPLYSFILLSVMFYMPTIALSYSASYTMLEQSGMDTVKNFPPIRVWGTIGFIVAMWVVDIFGFGFNEKQLYFSAVISIVLAVYSQILPNCPTSRSSKKNFVDSLGLRAFTLFKQPKMAIFFVFCMMLGMLLQITNAYADPYIHSFSQIEEYKSAFFVEHSTILISLSQISETLCILLIPFALKRFGIKCVMLISMMAWALRFALLGTGNPGAGVWMFIISMIVYGVAFDFFNISGSLFVEKETAPSIRSSAQGVFMLMTNGIGAIVGTYTAQYIVNITATANNTPTPMTWFIFAAFAVVIFVLFLTIFKYKHKPEEIIDVKH